VPAGLRQHVDADPHPRARDHPVVDGLLDARIGARGIANGGDAGRKRRLEVAHRVVELERERRDELLDPVERREHHVGVRIEKAG
jgi:hypothetical protein